MLADEDLQILCLPVGRQNELGTMPLTDLDSVSGTGQSTDTLTNMNSQLYFC